MSGLLGYFKVNDAPNIISAAVAEMKLFPWETS